MITRSDAHLQGTIFILPTSLTQQSLTSPNTSDASNLLFAIVSAYQYQNDLKSLKRPKAVTIQEMFEAESVKQPLVNFGNDLKLSLPRQPTPKGIFRLVQQFKQANPTGRNIVYEVQQSKVLQLNLVQKIKRCCLKADSLKCELETIMLATSNSETYRCVECDILYYEQSQAFDHAKRCGFQNMQKVEMSLLQNGLNPAASQTRNKKQYQKQASQNQRDFKGQYRCRHCTSVFNDKRKLGGHVSRAHKNQNIQERNKFSLIINGKRTRTESKSIYPITMGQQQNMHYTAKFQPISKRKHPRRSNMQIKLIKTEFEEEEDNTVKLEPIKLEEQEYFVKLEQGV